MDDRLRDRLITAAYDEMTFASPPWGSEATRELNLLIDKASTRPEPPSRRIGGLRKLSSRDYDYAEENMRVLAQVVSELARQENAEQIEPWMIEASLRRLCPIWPFCRRPRP